MKKEENFADLVKSVRKQLEISQEDLARELGVSFATVNRWENGKSKPIKLSRNQFEMFCNKMIRQKKLNM